VSNATMDSDGSSKKRKMAEGIYESFQNPKIKIGKLVLPSNQIKQPKKINVKEPQSSKKKHKFNII